ncbi:flagellar assembly protein FliW [Cellulomonas sp. DKR-3]|uniref:Flagellar assembly protein FliW n=1 Tax=Cellulomonas fulva TaxID=2835530 RepID=A0ABS5TVD2_9CELL|nr:flagellar assembly protein FliW [Cellulomonas fulva]MBT0993091.1 flagellar assembly protein FliW [Cellulomonas fulva]
MTATVEVGGARVPAALTLTEELPGLPGRSSYLLEAVPEADGLFALRSQDGPATRLFVVDPAVYVPGYAPELPGDGERRALVVVHPPSGTDPATANLLAPIVVDVAAGTAQQTVLDGDWPLRAPLG